MKKSILLLSSAVFLVVLSCGGGGGGGSATDGGGNTTDTGDTGDKKDTGGSNNDGSDSDDESEADTLTRSKNGVAVIETEATDNFGYLADYSSSYFDDDPSQPPENAVKPEGWVEADESYSFTLKDGRKVEIYQQSAVEGVRPFLRIAIVDGEPISHGELIRGASWTVSSTRQLAHNQDHMIVRAYSYFDEDGKAHSEYALLDDGIQKPDLAPHGDEKWTWYNVNYSYHYLTDKNADGTFDTARTDGDKGRIDVNGDQWTAELGFVDLDGKIDGTDVYGDVVYGPRFEATAGKFAGVDGKLSHKDGEVSSVSFGGFAGADASGTFAGSWDASGNGTIRRSR